MSRLLREYWERRALVWALARQSLIARYRGTTLGFLWTFLHPLLLFCVYALVFGIYVRVPAENYPAFLIAGLLPWTWFAQGLAIGTTSTLSEAPWIQQGGFSPAIPPLVTTVATCVNFLLTVPILVVVLFFLGVRPSAWLGLVPLMVGLQLLFQLGIVLATSALAVRFRDTIQLVTALLPVWFFMTPVIYPPSLVPEPYTWLLTLNPMAHLVGGFRAAFLGVNPPSWPGLAGAGLAGLVAFALGAAILAALRDRIPEEL